MAGEIKATLFEHIYEIRRRFLWSLASVFLASGLCFAFVDQIFEYFSAPVIQACEELIYTYPVEAFANKMKLSLMGGLVLSAPYILYHLFAFFKPALGAAWRRRIILSVLAGSFFFGMGVYFALRVIPFLVPALLADREAVAVNRWGVDTYFSFIFTLLIGCGIVFEMPVVMYFMARIRFIRSSSLKRHWRVALIVCLVLGALICPTPDILTWLIFCVPLFFLYGASFGIVYWVEKKTVQPI